MKIMYCPQCGGKARSESIGWMCESCQGFIDMQGGFQPHKEEPFMPPMTNADRIRAMSHDNLLNFFVELVGNMGCSPNGPFPCFKCDEDGYDECRKCWGEYLQQPAEEEDT